MKLFRQKTSEKNTVTKNHGTVSITRKLTGLLVGLLIGFTIIGLAYLQVLEANKNEVILSEKMSAFEKGIHEVQVELLNAKKSESDFYLKKYPIYLGKFDTRIIVASQTLKDITTLVKDEEDLTIVTKLGDVFEVYREKFINAANSQIEIGLDENTGLNAQLIKIKDDIQKNIGKHNLQALDASLLKIRKYESDFTKNEDEKHKDLALNEVNSFLTSVNASTIPRGDKNTLNKLMNKYKQTYLKYSDTIFLLKKQKAEVKQAANAIEPLFETLLDTSDVIISKTRESAAFKRELITKFFIATLFITALIVSLGLFMLTRSIVSALKKLQKTVMKVSDGDFTARANIKRNDELGQLSNAFDTLLDERLSNMVLAEQESEKLNESVIDLIRTVSQLAQEKNLSVKIPVSEDITGAISDSLNLLSKETALILAEVKVTSNQVASVSTIVKQQSDRVISVANTERQEVIATAVMLEESVKAMNEITQDAQDANKQADETIENTQRALNTVLSSAEGINSIRSTISEAEKRIKRLGERSQEISGIVSLINSIAERTHILALNASMHAASAGEAGRGFAVVADEVQRLAENAREATSEISTVVNNIRVETADTVMTMNAVISQVAEETKLAEQAGRSMKETEKVTNDLVRSVQHIASSSVDQAKINRQLLDRARQIQESTEQTGRELLEQTKSTDALVDYSNSLVSIVSVFKLPGEDKPDADDVMVNTGKFTAKTGIKRVV